MLLGDWIFGAQVLKEKSEEKARQEVEPHVPYYRIRILVKILILNLKGRPCLAWRATEEEIAPVAKVKDDEENNTWWWRWRFLNSDSRAKLLSFARARRGRTNWAKVVSMLIDIMSDINYNLEIIVDIRHNFEILSYIKYNLEIYIWCNQQ